MKPVLLAAAAGAALFSTAAYAAGHSFNGPGRIAPPVLVTAHGEGHCALRAQGGAVVAYAAPWNAEAWSLSVRAPGLSADQGGDLYGDERRMQRVSRLYVLDQSPAASVSRRSAGDGGIQRPLRAELVLTGEDGRVVCTDTLRLTPDPRGARAY